MKKKIVILIIAVITLACGFLAMPKHGRVFAETGTTYHVTMQSFGKGAIYCEEDCNVIESGASRTIIISPNSGYKLVAFYVNGNKISVRGNTYQLSYITQDITVNAEFDVITFVEKPIFYVILSVGVVSLGLFIFFLINGRHQQIKEYNNLSGDKISCEYSGVVQMTKIKNKSKKVSKDSETVKKNENEVIEIIKQKMNKSE